MKKNRPIIFLSIAAFMFCLGSGYAQQGKNGAETINTSGVIVNESTPLSSNAGAGSTSIYVSGSALNSHNRFAAPLAQGDLIMIIQIQGAAINGSATDSTWGAVTSYNNCGLYEFSEVSGVPNGTTINLACALKNSYTASGNVEVVRIPRYTSLTVNSGGVLTGDAWNGTTGGIVAVEVQNNTMINSGGSILATGIGFRGALVQNTSGGWTNIGFASESSALGGAKGEGIAGYETGYNTYGGMFGRGAPANGGGGGDQWNASGGGGGNAGVINAYTGNGNPDITTDTAWIVAWNLEYPGFANSTSSGGGRGGYTISWYPQGTPSPLIYPPGNIVYGDTTSTDERNREEGGGKGGRPLDYSTGRIFEGGGGGAGHEDQGLGGSGGNGGGIVYLLSYGTVSGGGSIISNGQNGLNDNSTGNLGDGSGGAGAGGTVLIYSAGAISGISVTANGGSGGDQFITSSYEDEGPGGGGGGGYIALSNGSISTQALGGVNGTTNSPLMTLFPPDGATKGGNGFADQPLNSVPFSNVLVNTSPNVSICPGSETDLSASGGNTYSWSPSAYLSCDTCADPVANPATTTTYVVTVSSGTCSGTGSIVVTVSDNAAAGVISALNNPVCQGADVKLSLTGSSGTVQWQYSDSGSNFSNIAGADSASYYLIPATGSAYYRVYADSAACSDTSQPYNLVVNPVPVTPALITNDSIICSPDSALISVPGNYASYLWSNGATTDYIYTAITGEYWVTVSNAYSCMAISGHQQISVYPALIPPVLSTTDSLFCSSDSTRISTSGTYASYRWNNGDTRSFTYADNSGGYWVTVTNIDGCSAVSGHQEVAVYPVPSVSIIVQGDTLASFNSINYQWFFGDSLIPGANNPGFVAHQSGEYAVQVRDSNGCTTLSNYVDVVVNGISGANEATGINVYPDPALNTVYISYSGEAISEVRMFDAIGQEIKRQVLDINAGKIIQLEVSDLPAGVFELMFYNGLQLVSVKQFVHRSDSK